MKFYVGQNEDYSLGDSISDSSEKLLRRGRGKVSIDVISVNREYMQSGTYFLQKVLLVSGRLLLVTRSRRHHEGF